MPNERYLRAQQRGEGSNTERESGVVEERRQEEEDSNSRAYKQRKVRALAQADWISSGSGALRRGPSGRLMLEQRL